MYTTRTIDRERNIDIEEEEVGTDRCIQHRTVVREILRSRGGADSCIQHRTIDREMDT
jgi:hypothetical protein